MEVPHLTLKGAIRIPQLGFGTWQLSGDTARKAVENALEIGYRHIDTAEMYRNEAEVGDAIRSSGVPRKELFVTSKVWRDNLHAKNVRRALLASLDRLGLAYLDLYLIHWPNENVPIEETIGALEELKAEGKIRAFGVSNFGPRNLRAALDASSDVACDQVEFHPHLYQRELLAFCENHGVVLTAYSPLARGRVLGDPVLTDIGRAHHKSAAQVALRWIVQLGAVAIPKAASREHAESNFDVFDFELTDEEMERIAAIDESERHVDPGFADWS